MPIDYDFIRQLEGFKTSGYVPPDQPGGSESGVTIGSGIDLGSKSIKGLRAAGVSDEILKKLKPYIGKRGKSAVDFLAKNPLVLPQQDIELLDNAVMNRDFSKLAQQFESDAGIPFESLPSELQTTMASVKHQYGNLPKRTPNFWKQMTSGQYDKALENLRNFGDEYSTRRNKEADLFQAGLIQQFLGDQQ